jgi:putative sterol carrier protein
MEIFEDIRRDWDGICCDHSNHLEMIESIKEHTMAEFTVKELVFRHEKAFLPEKAAGLVAVIQYHLTGEEGGDYIIHIKDDHCVVRKGIADDPTLTLTAEGAYLREVLLGREDGMKGFMKGKLQLAGDINLAMKMTSLFKMDE